MSEISERYDRLSAAFADTAAQVPGDRWDAQSPCEGWTARDVVRHVVDAQGMFLGFVGRSLPDLPSVDDDPAAAFEAARSVVLADLEDPERASTGFEGFFGPTTFEEAVERFLCFDLVVHRWDLARAASLDDRIDPEDLRWAAAKLPTFGDVLYTSGACAPALDPPSGADDQTRFLALVGRRSWA
jgi:uncharacterized protein (TIGR03086 family)